MSNETDGMFRDDKKIETSSSQGQGMFISDTYETRSKHSSEGMFTSDITMFKKENPRTILRKSKNKK